MEGGGFGGGGGGGGGGKGQLIFFSIRLVHLNAVGGQPGHVCCSSLANARPH